MNEATFDKSAIGFSVACILHCVALPVIAIAAPIMSIVAEAEWVHWLFTALAIASTGVIIAKAHGGRQLQFLVPALAGLLILGSALIAEPLGLDEVWPTIVGGSILATAHSLRLLRHR